jgi:predicted DNA-binding ribbon-helix-helix protein
VAQKPPAETGILKHSLVIAGHRTSVSLEHAFWSRLKTIAGARGRSIAALVAEIDARRDQANLSSAIRVFVLQALSESATNPRRSGRRSASFKAKGGKP